MARKISKIKRISLSIILIASLFINVQIAIGEEVDLSQDLTANLKRDLQIKLTELQEQIRKYEQEIQNQRNEQQTLKSETDLANKKIKTINLEIQEIDYQIKHIQILVGEKTDEIAQLEEKLGTSVVSMKVMLNRLWQYDNISEIEIILANDNISDFFSNLRAMSDFQKRIKISIEEIKALKVKLLKTRENLDSDLQEQEELKNIQEQQRQAAASEKKRLNTLITQTQGKEKEYQKLRDQTNKSAADIQKQIFTLEGSGLKMTFGEAYNYARFAASKTGVREALILAVLKYESRWGQNVGSGNWQVDMSPSQRPYFLKVTSELGLNPDGTPVSKRPKYGWGGAMGPAQMLPSVWLSYKPRISAITGHNPPSPWDIQDAFAAVSLKLANDGAISQNYNAEWKASMIYFAGGNWSKSSYRFYGDSVMELAETFQEQIDMILAANK